MSNRGGVAVYVTSHGFGHLTRTSAVINRMPAEIPVAIRCHPNLFEHWRERLRRPATFESQVSDVGALNAQGDSNGTDGEATLELASRVFAEAMARVDDEAAALREEGTAAVLCDAPPVPLVAARRAGIPGFLLANFTWADIYAPHAKRMGGDAVRLVNDLRAAYPTGHRRVPDRARGARMADVAPTYDVGMVVVPGRNRGDELRNRLGLKADDRLVYFYVGRYGQDDLGWKRLGRLEARGIHFVRVPPRAGQSPANLHVLPPTSGPGPTWPRRPTPSWPRRGMARRARRWSPAPRSSTRRGPASPSIAPSTAPSAPGAAASRPRPAISPRCAWNAPRTRLRAEARAAPVPRRRRCARGRAPVPDLPLDPPGGSNRQDARERILVRGGHRPTKAHPKGRWAVPTLRNPS